MKDTPSISTITENTTNDNPANLKDVHFTTTATTTTTTHQQNDENKNIILLDSDNNRTEATTNQIHSNVNNKTQSTTPKKYSDDDTMNKSMNDSLIDMNTSQTETPLPDWIALNESVLIRPYNMSGVISFIGPTHFQVRAGNLNQCRLLICSLIM